LSKLEGSFGGAGSGEPGDGCAWVASTDSFSSFGLGLTPCTAPWIFGQNALSGYDFPRANHGVNGIDGIDGIDGREGVIG